MKCEEIQSLLTDALYDELDSGTRLEFDHHLAGCTSCASSFARMQATLTIMKTRERSELSDAEWEAFSKNLQMKLAGPGQRSRVHRTLVVRPAIAWSYGIAALLLLAVGMYLGRTIFSERPLPTPTDAVSSIASGEPSSDSTTQLAMTYLERSRNLLIGVANLSSGNQSKVDLSRPQQVSRRLVEQGNVLAVALNKPDQQLLRQLVRDLQIILLQLANMETQSGVPVVEFVQKGMDEKSILLKINLEQMRAGTRPSSGESSQRRSAKNL